MPSSKKANQAIIPGLEFDDQSSVDPEYVISGAFPEQRHHLLNHLLNHSMLLLVVNQMKRGIGPSPSAVHFLI